MRAEGFEPPSSCEHRVLSPACRPFQHARLFPSYVRTSWEHMFVHATTTVAKAFELFAAGHSDSEVARRIGIARTTVGQWRRRGPPRGSSRRRPCPICEPGSCAAPADRYAYLLGLYLGDGYISRLPRTFALRFFLDAAYPGIVVDCRNALEVLRPRQTAWAKLSRSSRCYVVGMCSNHWPCLFPQHGPGRKHERPIELVPWQKPVVACHRRAFVRGLIHSDGCRIVARDRGLRSVRYHFSNRSEDIKRLYCESLEALGVSWTRPCDQQIAVYRKASVAILEEFVGPKR